MEDGRRHFNLRSNPTGKRNVSSRNQDKNSHAMTSHSENGASAGAISNTTFTTSDTAPQGSGGLPSGATPFAMPQEFAEFMREMRTSLSQLNGKLDKVITEITALKHDMAETKRTVSDLEESLNFTSEKVVFMEKEALPKMRSGLDQRINELEEKIILNEIHDRKMNLLVYGLPEKSSENVYMIIRDVFAHFMNISHDDAERIPLVNAHRLPGPNREHDPTGPRPQGPGQPPAIIIKFGRMIDRERLLHGFERRPRQGQQGGDPSGGEPSPFGRVTIRTDLPQKMKKERGRLASIAYKIRKRDGLATRIKIVGTKVLLQTRKSTRSGSTPGKWANWSEV